MFADMYRFLRLGLVVSLCVSSSWLVGCNDDDEGGPAGDSGTHDASTSAFDASAPGIDATTVETGARDAAAADAG
jgi:hypothetical protein